MDNSRAVVDASVSVMPAGLGVIVVGWCHCHLLVMLIVVFSCVKGSMPKVGDKVMVEASYNANMPFKWNAVCVQMTATPQVSITHV